MSNGTNDSLFLSFYPSLSSNDRSHSQVTIEPNYHGAFDTIEKDYSVGSTGRHIIQKERARNEWMAIHYKEEWKRGKELQDKDFPS